MAKLLTLKFSQVFLLKLLCFQKSHSPCRKKTMFEKQNKNNKKGGQVIALWWPSYWPYGTYMHGIYSAELLWCPCLFPCLFFRNCLVSVGGMRFFNNCLIEVARSCRVTLVSKYRGHFGTKTFDMRVTSYLVTRLCGSPDKPRLDGFGVQKITTRHHMGINLWCGEFQNRPTKSYFK